MPSGRILLVEDESNLALLLSERLTHDGYQVETCSDGDHGLIQAASGNFDAAILDIMLPDRSGLDVCRELRHRGIDLPILMLTARSSVTDRVTGLKLGADDYLGKPFEVPELLARIEALLRRARIARTLADSVFQFDNVTVDHRSMVVKRRGQTVALSAREFQLLSYLIAHRENTVTREELLDKVWGYHSTSDTRTVDVHIAQLRQKLEDNPKQARHIITVYGYGYKFVPSPEAVMRHKL